MPSYKGIETTPFSFISPIGLKIELTFIFKNIHDDQPSVNILRKSDITES